MLALWPVALGDHHTLCVSPRDRRPPGAPRESAAPDNDLMGLRRVVWERCRRVAWERWERQRALKEGGELRGKQLQRAVRLSKRIRRRSIELRFLGLVALTALLLNVAVLVFGATGVLCDSTVSWPGHAFCKGAGEAMRNDTGRHEMTLVLAAGLSLVALVVLGVIETLQKSTTAAEQEFLEQVEAVQPHSPPAAHTSNQPTATDRREPASRGTEGENGATSGGDEAWITLALARARYRTYGFATATDLPLTRRRRGLYLYAAVSLATVGLSALVVVLD